jgi:hypothetical protein
MAKGIEMFDQGNLPGAILALEAAVQADQNNTTVSYTGILEPYIITGMDEIGAGSGRE